MRGETRSRGRRTSPRACCRSRCERCCRRWARCRRRSWCGCGTQLHFKGSFINATVSYAEEIRAALIVERRRSKGRIARIKRSKLFIGAYDETLSVTMRVNNPDCLPAGIHRQHTAPTPTGLAQKQGPCSIDGALIFKPTRHVPLSPAFAAQQLERNTEPLRGFFAILEHPNFDRRTLG